VTETKETGLLVEGMQSYPKALGALNEFGRLVVSTIRGVVIEDLDSLSRAIGIRLAEDEVGNYVRPNRLVTDNPKDAMLGVKIDRIGELGWGLYFYIWWSKSQAKVRASIWLRDSNVAQSIVTAFKKIQSTTLVELDDSDREVCISRVLVPHNADQLPLIMSEVDQAFSQLWTKVGGLGKFLKP
jgi:hypothetical protein